MRDATTKGLVGARDLVVSLILATAWVSLVRPGGLDTPFFWDEADVYVPGSVWLSEHGLDVTPSAFPDDYSRGHPPLLYLLAAIAFRLFGASPTTGHLVVLPFTIAALAATYLLGGQLFGRIQGAAAALMLAATPLFVSIGNMLLPEIVLTALAVASFALLARGKLVCAALCGVGAVLIKETGIFGAAGIGVAVLADWRMRRGAVGTSTRATLVRLWWAATPLIALLAFFGWQRAHVGYFVYPHHADLLGARTFAFENLITVGPSLLLWHGRWLFVLTALGFGALALRRGVCVRPLATQADAEPAPWRPRRRALWVGMISVVFFYATFFAKMFWLERYALIAHPLVLVLLSGLLFAPTARRARGAASEGRVPRGQNRALLLVASSVTILCAATGVASMRSATAPDAEEQTFAYADVIATHQAAFASITEPEAHVLTTWPMTVELREPYLGYVRHSVWAEDPQYVADEPDAPFTHAVVNAASARADAVRAEAARWGMHVRQTFRRGAAPTLEVWTR